MFLLTVRLNLVAQHDREQSLNKEEILSRLACLLATGAVAGAHCNAVASA